MNLPRPMPRPKEPLPLGILITSSDFRTLDLRIIFHSIAWDYHRE